MGFARIYVEVDAGTGQHVTFDLKITVHSRNASDFAPVVGELETSSAQLSDEHLPDQQPDDPEGTYITSLFPENQFGWPDPSGGGESWVVVDRDVLSLDRG